jgi:lipopolysaccharide/colanic/teichoic acid biosynthesis glycosyltransferase
VHKYVAKSLYADAREGAYVCVGLGGSRKRPVDIAVTSIALTLLMPILLATARLVWSVLTFWSRPIDMTSD